MHFITYNLHIITSSSSSCTSGVTSRSCWRGLTKILPWPVSYFNFHTVLGGEMANSLQVAFVPHIRTYPPAKSSLGYSFFSFASKAVVELSKLNTILFPPRDAFLMHMYSSEDGIRSSVVPLRQTSVVVHVWLCLDSNFPVSSVLVAWLGYGNSVGYIQILVGVLSLIVQMEVMVMLM